MHRFHCYGLWSVGIVIALCARAADYHFPTQTLTVPDGFVVEQIAGPPIIERPISGSFDEQGRLYVTDSSGSNDKVEKQLAEKPHRVMRLDAVDGQGRFSRSRLFAGHMMFPEGCLWYDGSLYVSAPPSIWKLTDTDADGTADERSEWHQGKTLTACANDLHGPYLGLDGWIYWCKGAFAQQIYERPGRAPLVTRASHIFRAPPDHSDLEFVLTAGMDNPVGVAFSLAGERFMCGTFLMQPEAGKRDGVVHAVYGGVYGKPNDVLEGHKRTGDLMPVMTHLGAAAPCSIIRNESQGLGADYEDNLFVCCFNLHKVVRLALEPDGATFKTRDSDFLVSDNPDFHPTDVIEDADGSLIVIDTGGWYKLCCPTSQLSKPDVLGAIYRIRRVGAPRITDPWGLQIAWEGISARQATALLADGRPAVRKQALRRLSKMGAAAVPALSDALHRMSSDKARANVVWALTRIDAPPARAAVREALSDSSDLVRHAATISAGLWRDKDAEKALMTILEFPGSQLQRAAAEALGRVGEKAAAPALLRAAAQTHDRVLEHSLIYALIEIDDPPETIAALDSASASERRAALIALDQMDDANLDASTVGPLLSSKEPLLRQTAVWIAGHHPEWGSELAGFFKSRLAANGLSPDDTAELRHQLIEFAGSPPIQEVMGNRLCGSSAAEATRELLLEAISLARCERPPRTWFQGVSASLEGDNSRLLGAAIEAARALDQSKEADTELSAPLLRLAHNTSLAPSLRIGALEALPSGTVGIDPQSFELLRTNLHSEKPVSIRNISARVLAKLRLTEEQLLALSDCLEVVGPLEMRTVLDAFEQTTNTAVGLRLVAALEKSKSAASLRPEALEKVLARFARPIQERGERLLAAFQEDRASQSAHLTELLASLGKGDIRRGQALFNSPRAACSSCHAMGYLGGHVGPDLTRIGQVRTERDLLESIAYPSASFVRSFEPYVVKTKSDEYSGILRKDAPDEVVLVTGPSAEVRIPRSDIVDIRPGTVSVMPAGFAQQLTPQELADLLAFLKATKWGAH